MRFLAASRRAARRGDPVHHGRRVERARFRHVLGDRARHRPLGRPDRPLAARGLAGREVAWGVAREFAGRGYAHEAAVAAMDYAVDVLGWDHVIHTIDPENTARSTGAAAGAVNEGPVSLPAPLENFPSMPGARAPTSGGHRGGAVAMTDMPPSRFRVVERGRRLEVIDTQAGKSPPARRTDAATGLGQDRARFSCRKRSASTVRQAGPPTVSMTPRVRVP